MTVRISSAVTTRKTPGIFLAALVSIDLIRPCAMVLRKILPYNMPGRRRLWVYSARPETLSRASSRGRERPIWLPAVAPPWAPAFAPPWAPGVVVAISGLLHSGRAPGAPRARHGRG